VSAPPPHDLLGRPLRDLRLSVTDRCNFRCRYCMPKEVFGRGYDFLPKADILSFEELTRLARVFVGLGVEKVRLTGGEPLLRRDLERLVAQMAGIENLHDLALTTNGVLLPQKARVLHEAGLRRVTVSLDALDDTIFRAMNDVDFPVSGVLAGIDAALAAGFAPIKINMVVKRGLNENELAPMARRFSGPEFVLRFIEYMDVGNSNGWRMADVVPATEILERVRAEIDLTPLAPNYSGETAVRYRTAAGGEVGVIASVTQPFCRGCTRARITADGRLHTCLFSATAGVDLRGALRACESDEALAAMIGQVWQARGDRYSELRTSATASLPKAEMSLLGG
jgi:GTP 3',8-cyclase